MKRNFSASFLSPLVHSTENFVVILLWNKHTTNLTSTFQVLSNIFHFFQDIFLSKNSKNLLRIVRLQYTYIFMDSRWKEWPLTIKNFEKHFLLQSPPRLRLTTCVIHCDKVQQINVLLLSPFLPSCYNLLWVLKEKCSPSSPSYFLWATQYSEPMQCKQGHK